MPNASAQLGGLQSENGGHACRHDDGEGGTFCPGGSKTENQESSDASKTDEVEKRGSFLRHIFMHFSRYVPLFVQRGLNLTHFEPSVSGVSGLHDHGSDESAQESKREADGKDRLLPKEQPGQKDGGDKKGQNNRKVIQHDVEVFGLKKIGIHP